MSVVEDDKVERTSTMGFDDSIWPQVKKVNTTGFIDSI